MLEKVMVFAAVHMVLVNNCWFNYYVILVQGLQVSDTEYDMAYPDVWAGFIIKAKVCFSLRVDNISNLLTFTVNITLDV